MNQKGDKETRARRKVARVKHIYRNATYFLNSDTSGENLKFKISDELLQGLVTGNDLAFKEIYHLNVSAVYYMALRLLKSEKMAEAFVVETFLTLRKSREGFSCCDDFNSYMTNLLRKLIKTYLIRALEKQAKLR